MLSSILDLSSSVSQEEVVSEVGNVLSFGKSLDGGVRPSSEAKVVFRDEILAVKVGIGKSGTRYDKVDGVKLNRMVSRIAESFTAGQRCIATVLC